MAWGSRGDLQPVTSLAMRLKQDGREVIVFATPPATDLLQANGINYVAAKENVEDFVQGLFGQADLSDRSVCGVLKLAKVAKAFLNSPDYVATQKADMASAFALAREFKPDMLVVPNIIYGPFMSIAEALQIPVVTLDLQINHPTSKYPLFTMEMGKVPAFLNRSLYRLKALIYPKTISSKFDMMRDICGLPRDRYSNGTRLKIWPHDLPQLCAVSPSLCPQPADWPRHKHMGGWLIKPSDDTYTPPEGLPDFLTHKPVYIGFGSMKGNPEFCKSLSTLAIKALHEAGVKGVLLGGWAGLTRDSLDTSTQEGARLFDWAQQNVFEVQSVPHDWLFPHCRAVVHHGGAGTLAAGVRAGCPTIVCAMQGDQPFHGSLVQTRGLGRYLGMVGSAKVTSASIAAGIREVISDEAFAITAKALGEQARREDGAKNALEFIDKMAAEFSYPWPTRPAR